MDAAFMLLERHERGIHVVSAEPGRAPRGVVRAVRWLAHEWGSRATGIMLVTAPEGKTGAIASHMDRLPNS